MVQDINGNHGENPDNHDDKDYGKYLTEYENDRAIFQIK